MRTAAAMRPEAPGLLAFETFFERNYAPLARALYLLTGDAAEAEDEAQEAMVRVYERWDRVSTMASPEGYLFRTAMNLNRSWRRRLRSQHRRRVMVAPRVREPHESAETGDELARALASLPAAQRRALILVEWLGMSDDEAGEALGIRPVSVRVRISRAKSALRAAQVIDDA
jgi:RNA polymerase sigma-70 factor, ECF subfamily